MIHRVKTLHVLDASTLDNIPITPVPRILLDLAPSTPPNRLTRMCHEAWVRHRAGPQQIERCIARNPRKPGRYHATRQAFESDVARRRRSNHIAYTDGDVFDRDAETIADLRPRLHRRSA